MVPEDRAAAGIVPLSLAWIGDSVDYRERQTTIARFMMGQVSGLIPTAPASDSQAIPKLAG